MKYSVYLYSSGLTMPKRVDSPAQARSYVLREIGPGVGFVVHDSKGHVIASLTNSGEWRDENTVQ